MKKHRRRTGLVLVEGVRAVEAACKASTAFDTLFCSRDFACCSSNQRLLQSVSRLGGRIVSTTPGIIESISTLASPQEVIAVVSRPDFSIEGLTKRAAREDRSVLVWFDRVSDPTNLGAILRSAHCLGASGYLSAPGTVGAFNPRAVRASAGAAFFLPGVEEISLARAVALFRPEGYKFVAASPRSGVPLQSISPPERALIMVGEEADGLSLCAEESADIQVHIPMVDEAESLNVAAASALLLYHVTPLWPPE